MARNKRRKPKFSGATQPRSVRMQTQLHTMTRRMRYYDPGKNPQPRRTIEKSSEKELSA